MAFGRRAGNETPEVPAAARPVGPTETILDAGSELRGELRFADSVRLEGHVEGQIKAGGTVVVGEGAEIDATIEADALVVFGTVLGDIRVRRQATLHKSARVEGEIQTAGIVVEEGARFKGCIVIGPDESSAENAPVAVPPKSSPEEGSPSSDSD